jgi:NTP pyrophosphatase (non-canonical NTP hydrolase)
MIFWDVGFPLGLSPTSLVSPSYLPFFLFHVSWYKRLWIEAKNDIVLAMKEYEKYIKEYLEERDWDKLRPADMAKSICIEAGELLEIFQWSTKSLDEVKDDKKTMEKIKKELADVLNYCFTMSVSLGVDTEKIMRAKLEKVKEKYPAHIVKGSKEPGTEEDYHTIKKEYRMKGDL